MNRHVYACVIAVAHQPADLERTFQKEVSIVSLK